MVAQHARDNSGGSRRRVRWILATTTGVVIALTVSTTLALRGSSDTTTTTSSTLASTVTTTTTPATTTIAPPVASVTISAVGDTELGNTPKLPPNATTYFAPVRAALTAPIEFANLEGTMTNGTDSKCGESSSDCYAFRVPPSYAHIYRSAGFNVLNSANNHSHDFGTQGVIETSAALRSAGIAQAGLPGQIAIVRDGTIKVAFVDFAPYGNTNNLLDFTTAAHLIARAHQEARLVVVYMHAGAEGSSADHVTKSTEYYVGENRGNPYAFAHAAIEDGADLVLASGPHVLRGMQFYRGHLIAYSLGDFENYYDFSSSGTLALSAILHVTLSSSGSYVAGHFTSLLLNTAGQATIDPRHGSASFVNQLSRQDFGSTAAIIGANGKIAPPT